MSGQIISIKINWDGVRFHCPACGAEIFDDQGVTTKACSHLLFTWFSELGEMDHVSPALSENLRRIAAEMDDEEDEDLPNPCDPDYAKLLEDEDVVFCLDSSGMACGQCGMTVAIGIRFPEGD